jgi:hypothetical protein
MHIKIKLLLLFVLPLIFSCGSEKASNEIIILQEVNLIEGSLFSIDLPQGVTAKQEQPEAIYFSISANTINGVAPNVDQNQSFNIYLSDDQVFKFNIENSPFKEINEPTRNYAFANSNIGKYNQFIT